MFEVKVLYGVSKIVNAGPDSFRKMAWNLQSCIAMIWETLYSAEHKTPFKN